MIVIILGELFDFAQGLDAPCCRAESLAVVVERLLAGNLSRLLCLQMLRGHSRSGIDGVFHSGEVGILKFGTDITLDGFHAFPQLLVFAQIAFQFVAEGQGIEFRIASRRQTSLVFLPVEFHLAPSHELRLAHCRQFIELLHYGK